MGIREGRGIRARGTVKGIREIRGIKLMGIREIMAERRRIIAIIASGSS